MPAQRGDVPEQARLRQLAPPSQVICGFVHVQGVPVHDRGDDHVQGHDAFLLTVVRPVSDAALGMGEHRARQCVACLALVETRLALQGSIKIRGVKVADIDTVERPNADPERLFGFQTEDGFAV